MGVSVSLGMEHYGRPAVELLQGLQPDAALSYTQHPDRYDGKLSCKLSSPAAFTQAPRP